jgi:hypothetical protein
MRMDASTGLPMMTEVRVRSGDATAQNIVSVGNEPLAQVRAQETGPAGHEHSFS